MENEVKVFKDTKFVDSEGIVSYTAHIPVNMLQVDERLQRQYYDSEIKKTERFAKSYRECCAGDLIVARFERNGKYFYHVCDGQHRLRAFKRAIEMKRFPQDSIVPCKLLTNISENNAIEICNECNGSNRTNMRNSEKYDMDRKLGNPQAVFISDLLKKYGFKTISKFSPKKTANIVDGKNIVDITKTIKGETVQDYWKDKTVTPYLAMAFNLLSKVWIGQNMRTDTKVIRGMYGFMKNYGKYIKEEGITEDELVKVFNAFTPDVFLEYGKEICRQKLVSDTNSGNNFYQYRPCAATMLVSVVTVYDFKYNMFQPSNKTIRQSRSDFDIIQDVLLDTYGMFSDIKKMFQKTVMNVSRNSHHGYGEQFGI